MGQILVGMTMSLDGFVNDRNRDVSPLYPDLKELGKTDWHNARAPGRGAPLVRAYWQAGRARRNIDHRVSGANRPQVPRN